MTATTKPCACGRKGCAVTRRDWESPAEFHRRDYRDKDCYLRHKNELFAERDKERQERAIAMKRAEPKRSYVKIARELRMDQDRCRDILVAAGVMEPRLPREYGTVEAPPWYERPSGRIQALRQAHGIVVP